MEVENQTRSLLGSFTLSKKVRIMLVVALTVSLGGWLAWAGIALWNAERYDAVKAELVEIEESIPLEWTKTIEYEDLRSLCVLECRQFLNKWQNLNPSNQSITKLAEWSASLAGETGASCAPAIETWRADGGVEQGECIQQVGNTEITYNLGEADGYRAVEITIQRQA